MSITGSMQIALLTFLVVVVVMVFEAIISRRHEKVLRDTGAIEPAEDVYVLMQAVYPLSFVGMITEGGLFGVASYSWWMVGAAIFLTAKALKFWAIASLGIRWTFRVLVPINASFVQSGPYRWVLHPNYIAVIGELLGVALMMKALVTGVISIIGCGLLIAKRISVENRALGRIR